MCLRPSHSWFVCLWLGVLSCSRQSASTANSPDSNLPAVELSKPPDIYRKASQPLPEGIEGQLLAQFRAYRAAAAPDYPALEATLGTPAPNEAPDFDVEEARFYELVTDRLGLTPAQRAQLSKQGAISLQLPGEVTMGRVYASLWQADLPTFVTTDSILHAWHRTYDRALERHEVTTFSSAYRDLLEGLANQLKTDVTSPSPKLVEAATRLDLYVGVARTLLGEFDEDAWRSSDFALEPLKPTPTHLAKENDVKDIVAAAYHQELATVPVFGEVDFTQFKPRGHYTHSDGLARYFRALMWMGRADTGFKLTSPATARVAFLMALLAERSGKLDAFQKVQKTIDYFVGSSNGVPLVKVVEVARANGVRTLADLEDDARVAALAEKLLSAAPTTRVTSEIVMSQGTDTPPPAVFQLSNQRFTLDSFVHQRVSSDRIEDRTMVSGLDVMAAMGSAEATRLSKSELEAYSYSPDMHALRQTIDKLPVGYWQSNIYTRWFDALRTLHQVPEGPYLPDLLRTQVWQRKQLNNQLASWAELRHDTILYVAQVYSTILCEFPDVYLEPYPEFYDRVHDMALEAQQRLDDPHSFKGFVEIMARLSDIARRELTSADTNTEDQAFLKELVKLKVLDGGCGGPTHEWTGWYRDLYPGRDQFDYEPTIADVYTDGESLQVLNVAAATPEIMVLALQTQNGPTLFAGPVSSYREFVGRRTTDEEWQAQILSGKAPPPPAWNTLSAGKGKLPKNGS